MYNIYNAQQSLFEKGQRWDHNFNIAMGSVALAGAIMSQAYPVVSGALAVFGGFRLLQAVAGEAGRHHIRNKRLGNLQSLLK